MVVYNFRTFREYFDLTEKLKDYNPFYYYHLENSIREVARNKIPFERFFYIKDHDGYLFCLWKDDEFISYSLNHNVTLFDFFAKEIGFKNFKRFIFSGSKNIIDYLFKKFDVSYEESKYRCYYNIESIDPDFNAAEGKLEMADINEIQLLAEYIDNFNSEFYEDNKIDEEGIHVAWSGIQNNNLYQWSLNGKPVAIAQVNFSDFDFPLIGFIYVNKNMRGKNIGASMVHEISKGLLGRGSNLCSLMTDGYNPYSNRSFKKAGYKLYGEYVVRYKNK